MEILSAIFYFSNFALSATAVFLAVLLFRRFRNYGWLLLAGGFTSPFFFLLLRLFSGHRLFTYKIVGAGANGVTDVTIHYEFPVFYLAVVIGLIFLVRAGKHGQAAG
jgi:hypothetical protein